MSKTLDEMTDAEVLRDQAAFIRDRSKDSMDPRVPIARADRVDAIADKLENKTFAQKKAKTAEECAKASATPV